MVDEMFDKLIDYDNKVKSLATLLEPLGEAVKVFEELKKIRELVIKYRKDHVEDIELTEIFDEILKITE
jgi:hypothetical protein